ncbi:MAG: hypothetical protein ACM336_09230 [Acidobacteriota bacterium]
MKSTTRLLALLVAALPAVAQELSPAAQRAAQLIGILPRLEELRATPYKNSIDALRMRQDILEAVMAASFDVDSAIAEIQDEQAQIQAARDYLEAQRDRRTSTTNLAAIILSTGIGVVATGLQFGPANAGNAVGVASGAAATALSIVGIRQQRGGKRTLPIAPNMLARVFDRPGTAYPEDVWEYLSGSRDELLRQWQALGLIDLSDAPAARAKIDFLTASITEHRKFTIEELVDRGAMLSDVRARIALMKIDLRELMQGIRAISGAPVPPPSRPF